MYAPEAIVPEPVPAENTRLGPAREKLDRPGAVSAGGDDRHLPTPVTMAVFHDEVEIEDFQYDEDSETYFYPCPCGDNFCITKVTSGPLPAIRRSRRVFALATFFPRSRHLAAHNFPRPFCRVSESP